MTLVFKSGREAVCSSQVPLSTFLTDRTTDHIKPHKMDRKFVTAITAGVSDSTSLTLESLRACPLRGSDLERGSRANERGGEENRKMLKVKVIVFATACLLVRPPARRPSVVVLSFR